ncbi:NAD(P)-dependent oxidoreductase [Agromyces rhizosphaerae]|uniref:NAD(P)-dependent oxidoreductase n=1 Tax=Agromyces rhizosphaerae TaxID=88374 RepID=A0A9W6CWU3_9MICO|nr:SDR family oxidoreductase [Agromyces rhizosphaerae]GLI27790.1 NAD(P)-dependent oxidoreductase [Agromyces rhizosphaerae]
MTILVTGATGHLGALVIDALLARGADPAGIVAGARTPSDLDALAERGIRVVRFDYADPETLAPALEGIDALLLVSGTELGARVAQHRNVIDAAAAAGVGKLVYTSAPHVADSDLPLAPDHRATEEAIAESGVPAVILRNNWYSENYTRDLAVAAESGTVVSSVGDGRIASAPRADYAEAAAVVLLEEGHLGETYELAGDHAWTFEELAAAYAEVLGRDVEYVRLSSDERSAALLEAGAGEGAAGFVAALEASIRDGALADADGTLARLIGRRTTPLVETLRRAA